jgi:hypothetical protein
MIISSYRIGNNKMIGTEVSPSVRYSRHLNLSFFSFSVIPIALFSSTKEQESIKDHSKMIDRGTIILRRVMSRLVF